MNKKLITVGLMLTLAISTSALAFADVVFNDIEGNANEQAILTLEKEGIVNGVGNATFQPDRAITNAEALVIMNGFYHLSLDYIRFIKAPLASDYYTNVGEDMWYTDPLIISAVNGLPVDKNLFPNDTMDRETFYYLLVSGMEMKFEMPMFKLIPVDINDESEMTPEYQGAIQRAIAFGFVALDDAQNFDPKGTITRGEAADAVVKAMTYLEAHEYEVRGMSGINE